MSLVERALKKFQQSLGAAPAPAQRDARPKEPDPGQRAAFGRTPPSHVESPRRIVAIDRNALRAAHLLAPARMERRIASQYQQIKRPLIASALGRSESPVVDAHLIMLTSALPGEGKTFTSINLALSMALEKDVEVVLVDADVTKQHLGQIFGLQHERGLLDLLTDDALHPDSVILRTDVPRLSILPAGSKLDTATELLSSERMKQVVSQLAGADGRRIMLFDSPPLLLSTESQALVASVGQVVLIVRAEFTHRSAVNAALEAIADAKPVSLILNQSSSSPELYYGYGSYGAAAAAEGA